MLIVKTSKNVYAGAKLREPDLDMTEEKPESDMDDAPTNENADDVDKRVEIVATETEFEFDPNPFVDEPFEVSDDHVVVTYKGATTSILVTVRKEVET